VELEVKRMKSWVLSLRDPLVAVNKQTVCVCDLSALFGGASAPGGDFGGRFVPRLGTYECRYPSHFGQCLRARFGRWVRC